MSTQMEQDLEYVRRVIEHSRQAVVVDATPIMIWAGLTLIGVLLTYTVPALDSPWLWLVLVSLAWLATGWRVWQIRSKNSVVVLVERAMTMSWFAVLSAMTVIGFVGTFSQVLHPGVITPIFAALFGIGFAVSSVALDRGWLLALALAWWLGAVALFLAPLPLRLAIYGGLVAALLLLPAAWLHRRRLRDD